MLPQNKTSQYLYANCFSIPIKNNVLQNALSIISLLLMWPLDITCAIYIYQILLKYRTRVFLIILGLKPEFKSKQSRPLEHNRGTKQQNSDWGHQDRANGFGRLAGKWSLEIFSGMWC